jgi:hypothetical protein
MLLSFYLKGEEGTATYKHLVEVASWCFWFLELE